MWLNISKKHMYVNLGCLSAPFHKYDITRSRRGQGRTARLNCDLTIGPGLWVAQRRVKEPTIAGRGMSGSSNSVTGIERLRRRGQRDNTFPLEGTAISRIVLAVFLAMTLSACEGRNPAQVAAQRGVASIPLDTTAQPPEIPAVEPIPPEVVASDGIPTLPSEQEGTRQLDLRRALDSGVVSVGVNDPQFPPRLEKLVDDDTTTLSRSEDVSPLILRFSFGAAIHLKIVRIYLSYSTYDWKLHLDSGAPVVIREAAEEAWSEIDFPEAQETQSVRLEIRRLQRDNYVHVNEIEFYVAE